MGEKNLCGGKEYHGILTPYVNNAEFSLSYEFNLTVRPESFIVTARLCDHATRKIVDASAAY